MAYLNNRYDSIHTTTTVVLYLSTQLLDLYLSIQFLCLYQDNCCAIIQIPVVPLSKTTIVTLYWQMSMLLPIETAIITLYWRLLSLYLTRQLLWFHPDSYYDFIQTAIMISSRLLLWFHPDRCCTFILTTIVPLPIHTCYDFIQTAAMISSRSLLCLSEMMTLDNHRSDLFYDPFSNRTDDFDRKFGKIRRKGSDSDRSSESDRDEIVSRRSGDDPVNSDDERVRFQFLFFFVFFELWYVFGSVQPL